MTSYPKPPERVNRTHSMKYASLIAARNPFHLLLKSECTTLFASREVHEHNT